MTALTPDALRLKRKALAAIVALVLALVLAAVAVLIAFFTDNANLDFWKPFWGSLIPLVLCVLLYLARQLLRLAGLRKNGTKRA